VNARDDVLARVRRALAGAPEAPAIDRGYRRSLPGIADPLALFVERVADYRASVEVIDEDAIGAALDRVLTGHSVIVPPGFPYPTPAGAVPDAGHTAAELDVIDAVVTTAVLGIAVTGTIVLDHGPGQGRRALTLVPDRHVCVVGAEQIVGDLPGAVARLDAARPQTWISGPSATSDIELNRVEGVHGPRQLHVIVVRTS
jgi:L-lactate dehydrogenase complex protein LldG